MTIASMATGSSVTPHTSSNTTGAAWGNSPARTAGTALDCNAQSMSANEVLAYDARGETRMWNVFFASDPGLKNGDLLQLTKWQNRTLSTPLFMRVKAVNFEGNPSGTSQLWFAVCSEETTRRESP